MKAVRILIGATSANSRRIFGWYSLTIVVFFTVWLILSAMAKHVDVTNYIDNAFCYGWMSTEYKTHRHTAHDLFNSINISISFSRNVYTVVVARWKQVYSE